MEPVPKTDLAGELRISPVLVFVSLPVVSLALYGVIETTTRAREMFPHVLFVVLCYVLAASGWWLSRWKANLAGPFAVACALLFAILANFWLRFPGAEAFLAIPPALALPLVGFWWGAGLAGLESLTLIVLLSTSNFNLAGGSLALMLVWMVFGVTSSVYFPAQKLAGWSWSYFTNARLLLEEARDRQGELSRALGDLAHANQQLTRLNTLAQSLRQVAEDARLAKEQFVSNVSHELRTPLNMIIGFSEMILDNPEAYGDGLPSALLADLAIVRRNAGHLSDLIDDVLDLSQIEAEQMALMREYALPQEIIQAASEAVRPLFHSKHLFLKVEIEGEMLPIFCDRTRIREVLLNLLSNAGRFTEQGGVTVNAACHGGVLTVSVTDTGPGIPPDQQEKLFQPFQQLDGSIRRRYGGTGLGLNISKRFIEMHGGKIWVESQPGRGTTFSFQLPVAPENPTGNRFTRWIVPEWDYIHRVPESSLPRQKLRPRLVVSEHGGALKRLLTRYFGDAEVVAVESTEDAVREIDEVPSQLLVLNTSEKGSPGDGFNPSGLPYEIPVISCWVPGTADMASSLGAFEYLVKPISKQVLLETLDRIPLQNKTILIVDDEPEALRLFQRILHGAGREYHVLRARNGLEALRVMRQYRPDVILMDLMMPNMDGFTLLRQHADDPNLRDIPVIIISARDSSGYPIVTPSITITRKGGISVRALMECVQAVTQILSMPGQPAGPMSKAAPPAESAC